MKLLTLLVVAVTVNAQAYSFDRMHPNASEIIEKSMNYLSNEQYQESKNLYTAGEWSVNMKAYLLPALLGVGKLFARPTDEPTSFATSSVINLISETYMLKPSLSQIPKMINLGITSLPQYKNADVYSYYQYQMYNGVKVRGPLADGYVPGFIRGLTNIPSDADTTSATYMALAYADFFNLGKPVSKYKIPQGALDTFNTFRDVDRKPHYYNWLDGIKQSGAFLTWFLDDKDPTQPRGVFGKPDKGTRIPFGVNDVDCVVNANVMRVLTATSQTNHPGYADSCKLLNFSINNNLQKQCGIYYPNSYAVFFSVSNVYALGAQCLEDSKETAIKFMVSNQNADGSWNNEPGIGSTDPVQSTALAVIALVNYSKKGEMPYGSSVQAGALYLISQLKQKSDTEVYWKGEVFFAAVAQARNTVLWRSDAYTTALVALALAKAQAYVGGAL